MIVRNTNEGVTPAGTPITPGNSGGASGNAWDANVVGANATDASDNQHSHSGTLSNQIATGITATTSYNKWTTTVGTLVQHWFELYLYFTANPAASHRIYSGFAGATLGAAVRLGTTGPLTFLDTAGAAIPLCTTVNPIPLNHEFRIEGFIIGNAATGQVELKLFANADDIAPLEVVTSAANVNTAGSISDYRFGMSSNLANIGPYWQDDCAVSDSGYLGPYIPATGGTAIDNLTVSRRRPKVRQRRYVRYAQLQRLGRI